MIEFFLGVLIGVLFSFAVLESSKGLKRISKFRKREDLSKFKEYILSHSENFRKFSWQNENTADPQTEPLYDISEFKIKHDDISTEKTNKQLRTRNNFFRV